MRLLGHATYLRKNITTRFALVHPLLGYSLLSQKSGGQQTNKYDKKHSPGPRIKVWYLELPDKNIFLHTSVTVKLDSASISSIALFRDKTKQNSTPVNRST